MAARYQTAQMQARYAALSAEADAYREEIVKFVLLMSWDMKQYSDAEIIDAAAGRAPA